MQVWMNDSLVDKDEALISVFDHGLLYGDGVFEGIRIYHGQIFQCNAHLDRLCLSADVIRLKIPYGRKVLRQAIQDTAAANNLTDAYVRLVVTRGPGTLGLNPFLCSKPSTFIIVDQISMYSKQMYQEGIGVIIARHRRTHQSMLEPDVKSLNYLNNIHAKMESVDAGVPEAVMLNHDGYVTEASGDNIFIVKDGQIITPPPEAGILLGITRSVVMHLASEMGVSVLEKNLLPEELYEADECFLTGTGAEVIAVTSVDGRPVGKGTVGPITSKLLRSFTEFVHTDYQVPYAGGNGLESKAL